MRKNALTLVQYATVFPFRIPESAMLCVFCCESREDPEEFRKHMMADHKEFNVKVAFYHLNVYRKQLKADCTDLRCRLCPAAFTELEDIAAHLRDDHNKEILPGRFGLEVYKFGPVKWVCAYCHARFKCIRGLSRHTASHNRYIACPHCSKTYSKKSDLDVHVLNIHSTDQFRCRKCGDVFPTTKLRLDHVRESEQCWPYKCHLCEERLFNYGTKLEHLRSKHGHVAPGFKCSVCPLQFKKRRQYRDHFIKAHNKVQWHNPIDNDK